MRVSFVFCLSRAYVIKSSNCTAAGDRAQIIRQAKLFRVETFFQSAVIRGGFSVKNPSVNIRFSVLQPPEVTG